jgi:hypothetical protein
MSWTRPEADCTVTLECEDCHEVWHPEIFFEYRGVSPHGGMVAEYTADAFQCKECLGKGIEVD